MSESKEQQHTPTPWRLLNHGIKSMGGGVVYTGGGAHRKVHIEGVGDLECLVFDADDTAGNNKLAANARLILRAVNSHQALVDAVRHALAIENSTTMKHERDLRKRARSVYVEALALAEKES